MVFGILKMFKWLTGSEKNFDKSIFSKILSISGTFNDRERDRNSNLENDNGEEMQICTHTQCFRFQRISAEVIPTLARHLKRERKKSQNQLQNRHENFHRYSVTRKSTH